MGKRHITGDAAGWLKVKLEPSGRIVSLPEYIKVEFSSRSEKRDYFEILEGIYKGSKASVSAKSAETSWLGQPPPSYPPTTTVTCIRNV